VINYPALLARLRQRWSKRGASVQSMMRHATAVFTLAVYVHTDTKRMVAAVAGLPYLQPVIVSNG